MSKDKVYVELPRDYWTKRFIQLIFDRTRRQGIWSRTTNNFNYLPSDQEVKENQRLLLSKGYYYGKENV